MAELTAKQMQSRGGQSRTPRKRASSRANVAKATQARVGWKQRAEALEDALALVFSVSGDPVIENIIEPLLPLTRRVKS